MESRRPDHSGDDILPTYGWRRAECRHNCMLWRSDRLSGTSAVYLQERNGDDVR